MMKIVHEVQSRPKYSSKIQSDTNIHRVPKKGSHQTFGNNFLKS